MLSAFAQLDRAFILAKTKEGRERAIARGRIRAGAEAKPRADCACAGSAEEEAGPARDRGTCVLTRRRCLAL
jgi:hypothetical protein